MGILSLTQFAFRFLLYVFPNCIIFPKLWLKILVLQTPNPDCSSYLSLKKNDTIRNEKCENEELRVL